MQSKLILTGASFALLSLLVACDTGERAIDETADAANRAADEVADQTAMANEPGATHRVGEIAGNPDRYIGQQVTVVADLEEVESAYAFKLDEDDTLEGGIDNDLLVFSPKAANLAAIDDQWLNNKVRVTGTVQIMTVTELEREIGWDLDPELEAELEDRRPVLIASSIERVPD